MAATEVKTDELLIGPLNTALAAAKEGLKLDLACGTNLRPGYTGVDGVPLDLLVERTEGFEGKAPPGYEDYRQVDLLEFPWPFEDNSVAATYSSHFVEHIPHYLPGVSQHATDDGWGYFFAELYRVMEDGGICEFVHPFSRSDRAFWDPTHVRFIHYQTWFYLNKGFRLDMGANHYAPDYNFEVREVQTIHEPTLLENRSAEVIEFARQFYFNATDDLFVVLEVVK